MPPDRWAPVLDSHLDETGRLEIPWDVHLQAWHVYARTWGDADQSAETVADRGGFSADELDDLRPGWRDHARSPDGDTGAR